MQPPQSLIRVLTTLAILSATANAAAFDTHQQGNGHANRGLVHRHRQHQQARAASESVQFLPRAGAAYNETDHDTSASIEIGGQQTVAKTSAAVTPTAATTSAAIQTSATSSPVTSAAASSSSPVASVPVSSSSSVISSATSATSAVNPTVVVTSTQPLSSSSVSSSSSTSTSDSLSLASSSAIPTSSSSLSISDPISSSSVASLVESIVTESASDVTVTGTASTGRAAKTGSVVIKYATASSSASAAAASGGSKSGISGGTKIGIIVASVVGGVALGAFVLWTIIRKVKFKPTEKFAGRLVAIDLSPAADPFYEKTQRRFSGNSANSGSSADRQRRQFVDELDNEQYGQHVQHAQQYDMAGLPGADDMHGVPSHDFTAGAAPYYQHHQQPAYEQQGYSDDDAGYVDLRRGPSLTNGQQTSPTTFAGVGAGGAGLGAVSPINAYSSEPHYANYSPPQDGLAREPSLGRPTRGDGPYAAAAPHFASPGSRY